MKRSYLKIGIYLLLLTVIAGFSFYAFRANSQAKSKDKTEKSKRELNSYIRETYSQRIEKILLSMDTHVELSHEVVLEHMKWWKLGLDGDLEYWMGKSLDRQDLQIARLEIAKVLAKSLMSVLHSPPSGLESVYDELLELYSIYINCLNLAISPKGSIVTYSRSYAENHTEFRRLFHKLEVMRKN